MPQTNPIPHVMKALTESPWAIQRNKLQAICEIVALRATGIRLSKEQVDANLMESVEAAAARPRAQEPGGVAVINVMGVIMNRGGLFDDVSGMVGCNLISAQLQAAINNPDIKAIVLNIDSPGGMVAGVPELAAEIAACPKFVLAISNQLTASAAYWLGCQADEFVVSPSGEVGSIGVVSIHQDLSKAFEMEGIENTVITSSPHKYEGHPYAPLEPDALAHMQGVVNAYDEMFTKAVARGRGVSIGKVRSDFGQGRTLMAQDAVKVGMADRVGTLAEELRRLGGPAIPAKRLISDRIAEDEAPKPQAMSDADKRRITAELAHL